MVVTGESDSPIGENDDDSDDEATIHEKNAAIDKEERDMHEEHARIRAELMNRRNELRDRMARKGIVVTGTDPKWKSQMEACQFLEDKESQRSASRSLADLICLMPSFEGRVRHHEALDAPVYLPPDTKVWQPADMEGSGMLEKLWKELDAVYASYMSCMQRGSLFIRDGGDEPFAEGLLV